MFYDYSDFSILCSKIATESFQYALQKGCQYTVTDREIEVFIGVTYFMGLKKLPALRDYRRTDELGVPFVRDSMSRDRNEEIRKNLNFSNNLDPLRADDKAVDTVDRTSTLCINERQPMCPIIALMSTWLNSKAIAV